MSVVAAAIIGSAAVSYIASDNASDKAARSQTQSTQAGIAEQRYQFDKIQELLKPYVEAGSAAIGGQMDLSGLSGPEKEKAMIDQIQRSPTFNALIKQGETGILQNASATGGLRGGNTQSALAEFRPSVLSSLIQQRFNQFGGIAGLGQASAAGQAAAAQNTGNNITGLLQTQGEIGAARALAQGQNNVNLANTAGQLAMMYGTGAF